MADECRQFLMESVDMQLLDPGQAAVGAFHGLQRCRNGLELAGGSLVFGGDDPVDCCCEYACRAAVPCVEFGFLAATDAVDVKPGSGALTARGEQVHAAGEDAFVSAGAGAPSSKFRFRMQPLSLLTRRR